MSIIHSVDGRIKDRERSFQNEKTDKLCAVLDLDYLISLIRGADVLKSDDAKP